jgi:O-antigen/teichoic acid export membrane protein
MSKQHGRLLRNITSAGSQIVVQTFALFFLYSFLIDILGVERLGIWSIILASASAARISELGLGGSVTKFVASYRAQEDLVAVGEVLQTGAITIAVILGAILLAVYPLLAWLLPEILPASALDEARAILPYALASLWLNSVASIWTSGLDGVLRSDLRAGLAIIGTLAFLGMAWVGASTYGLLGLAVAQVAQGAILAVLGWIAIRTVVTTMPPIPVKWSLARLRVMLGYGVNFQINSVIMLLFEPTTKVLLGRYGELAAAGYFELAQRLVMKARAFIVESNRVVVPVFAGSANNVDDTRELYLKNARVLFAVVTPLFAGLIALMPAVSELWIGAYQAQFVLIAILLTGAWYVNAMSAPAYFAFLGHGRLRWLTASHLVMGACNAALGVLLGVAFGWHGVIAAFILSLLLGSALTIGAYHREVRVPIRALLSGHDYLLGLACFTAAGIVLWAYLSARGAGMALWASTSLAVAAMALVVLVGVMRHPTSLHVLQALAQKLRSRRPSGANEA